MGIPALTQPKRTILPADSGYDSTDPGGEGNWLKDGDAVIHGQTVTIAGSGYGSMPQFAFAGGSTGRIETAEIGVDAVDTGGFRLSDGADKTIEVDDVRGKVWRSDVWDGQTAIARNGLISHDWGSQIPSGSKVLAHWASKIDCDAPQFQWKQYRAEPTYNYSDGGPEICIFGWRKTTTDERQLIWRRVAATGVDNNTYYLPNDSMLPLSEPTWMTYEMYDQLSSENIADGVALYETFTGANRYTAYANDAARHFGEGVTDRRRYHVLQNYMGNYDGNNPTVGVVWIDDFAVQVAAPGDDLVRVYLCNTDDISTSTVREYQRPVEGWANTAAKVEINRGGLADGEYYLIAVANKNTQISATQVVLS